jgi:hypothetical protein
LWSDPLIPPEKSDRGDGLRVEQNVSFRGTAVLEFIAAWNRERAHPFRGTFAGYPSQAGGEAASRQAA